jgi:hypothetical protein
MIERAPWFISEPVMIVEDVAMRGRVAMAGRPRVAPQLLFSMLAGCAARPAVASCPALRPRQQRSV